MRAFSQKSQLVGFGEITARKKQLGNFDFEFVPLDVRKTIQRPIRLFAIFLRAFSKNPVLVAFGRSAPRKRPANLDFREPGFCGIFHSSRLSPGSIELDDRRQSIASKSGIAVEKGRGAFGQPRPKVIWLQ